MLIELKRCNSIGNIEGLLFLVSMLSNKRITSKKEVFNRSFLEKDIILNCNGALAFLEYLEYVQLSEDLIILTDQFEELKISKGNQIIDILVRTCISRLTSDGIFDLNETRFDIEKGRISLKGSAFPLAYAAIRNFLIMAGALGKESNGDISILETYETDFSENIGERKNKFTLEQLLSQQKEQSERGLEAEEFVLKLEKLRLPEKANRIKRISDFDVSAGYDIVSFQSSHSYAYNRFIEVKSFLGTPQFYWSENEIDVARIKGDSYVLCLVDYKKMNNPEYRPEYIYNPYEIIFADDNWLVNVATYKIKKV